jgi:hypothetical protein
MQEDIFKPITENESLHKISKDNGIRIVNFAPSKNLEVKSKSSQTVTFINFLGCLLIGKPTD